MANVQAFLGTVQTHPHVSLRSAPRRARCRVEAEGGGGPGFCAWVWAPASTTGQENLAVPLPSESRTFRLFSPKQTI